jgi:hypothetical protein
MREDRRGTGRIIAGPEEPVTDEKPTLDYQHTAETLDSPDSLPVGVWVVFGIVGATMVLVIADTFFVGRW